MSAAPRPQIELRIAISDSPRCRRPIWITFGRLRKNHFSTNFLHFARVTFQFLVQGRAAWTVSADIKAVSDRSRKYLVPTRAVLAAVAEKPLKNRVEGLNLLDAVGPSFLRIRPATGECFAPLAVGPSFFHDRPTGGECFAPFFRTGRGNN